MHTVYLGVTRLGICGAEHDAYIVVDRAYMPVVTGGMNTTLRDAARFGLMIRDRGRFNGHRGLEAITAFSGQVISQGARWEFDDLVEERF